jgi:hypothetical protein
MGMGLRIHVAHTKPVPAGLGPNSWSNNFDADECSAAHIHRGSTILETTSSSLVCPLASCSLTCMMSHTQAMQAAILWPWETLTGLEHTYTVGSPGQCHMMASSCPNCGSQGSRKNHRFCAPGIRQELKSLSYCASCHRMHAFVIARA